MAREHSQAYDVAAGPYVCLEVRDDGCGMDEATVLRVFEPFFTTKFTGRGIGLAAVHGIVRTSGGFIELRSSLGHGTTFRVFLPASQKKRSAEHAGRVPQRRVCGPANILVVDDEEMVRKLVCVTLRRHGYEVLEAKDGKAALQVLAECSTLPSVVLLDLAMPVMGGVELVPILAKTYAEIKIIVSSGYPEEDARKGFPPEAVAGFLRKPYNIGALAEKIGEVLNNGPDQKSRVIEFPRTGWPDGESGVVRKNRQPLAWKLSEIH